MLERCGCDAWCGRARSFALGVMEEDESREGQGGVGSGLAPPWD